LAFEALLSLIRLQAALTLLGQLPAHLRTAFLASPALYALALQSTLAAARALLTLDASIREQPQ
jgi:phytoene/squalene synthetase